MWNRIKLLKRRTLPSIDLYNCAIVLQASLFEASEREGADSIIKAQSPSQQGDAWRCTC